MIFSPSISDLKYAEITILKINNVPKAHLSVYYLEIGIKYDKV